MLYSIIPPILIVLSLIGIIIFLMKKAPKLALLEKESAEDENSEKTKKSFFGKLRRRNQENEKKDFKHNFLLFLEKITRKLKLLFLKLENLFTAWSEIIRQKRRIRENEGKYSNIESREEVKNIKKEGRMEKFFQRKQGSDELMIGKENSLAENRKEEEEIEDERMVEKKDIFEKILIERIATNPKDVEAYERLGEYYFDIENWNYAKECFKQVIKLNPNNRNVKMKMRKLGRLLSR